MTLHDSRGYSFKSAPHHRLELNLFKSHTHMHVLISNVTDHDIVLWSPECMYGDYSLYIEFRDTTHPQAVFRALPGWGYTGGMGNPALTILTSHDDIIVDLDFVSDLQWDFPITIEDGKRMDLEVRVGYRPRELEKDMRELYRNAPKEWRDLEAKRWKGETFGDWHQITVTNRSGGIIGPGKREANAHQRPGKSH